MNGHEEPFVGTERKEETNLVGRREIIVLSILLLLSLTAFVSYVSAMRPWQTPSLFLGAFLVCTAVLLLPRTFLFYRRTQELLKSETSGKTDPRSPRRGLAKAMATTIMFVLLLVAPLILTRFLDASTWIALVTGCITGYAASNLLFAAYAIAWQRRTGITLRRYKVWLIRSEQRRVLVESGIRRLDK